MLQHGWRQMQSHLVKSTCVVGPGTSGQGVMHRIMIHRHQVEVVSIAAYGAWHSVIHCISECSGFDVPDGHTLVYLTVSAISEGTGPYIIT